MHWQPLKLRRFFPRANGWAGWPRADAIVALLMLVAGCIYVMNAWSPSSYGHVLQVAGATNTGLVWGEPRGIRSDEWSVTTPLTQATVNNGFERFNHTSYYNEDLRINYALPIHDWGMAFKPTYWAYLLLAPATAYSLHYFLMLAIFIFGYARLMKIAGANAIQAYLLAISLYFCGFVQFFWNSNTSLFAFFPWIVVILCSRMHLGLRMLLYYWVACCWLIGNFYPPLFISLGFTALIFLAAYRIEVLRPRSLLVVGIVTAAACGTAVFYLWDYLTQTINTIYPGQRISVAGYYPRFIFLTQLWPAGLFDSDYRESVNFTNVTGIGTVGLYWTLAALCFANWTDWRRLGSVSRRASVALIAGLVLTMLWMYAPMPSWFARLLLWDRVPPERMVFASGLLWVFVVWHVTHILGLRVTPGRFGLYALSVLAGGLWFEWMTRDFAGPWRHLLDLAVIPVVAFAGYVAHRYRLPGTTAMVAAGAIAGVLVFGRFNPIQSAVPIFDHAPNALTETLKLYVGKDGVLPVQRDGLIGATLNGLGFRAVAHLVALPPMALWQNKFGPLSKEDESIFNRYAHIRIVASTVPRKLENDQVGVPAKAFRKQPIVTLASGTNVFTNSLSAGGSVEDVTQNGRMVTIRGWAPWGRNWGTRRLILGTTSDNVEIVSISDQERWDVVHVTNNPDRLLSGFVIQLQLREDSKLGTFDLYARDDALDRVYLLPTR
jgi:hypothetical protein